jgi:mono/diheme cytochrome c family protein
VKRLAALAAASLLAAAAACSARRGEPIAGPFTSSSGSVQRGERVFQQHCSKCHPGGEAGLGPGINDKPLPKFLMKIQVRRGLGAMPSFSDGRISDDELDDLVEFLVAYRRHG